jgi:hypothetical protein
MGLQIRISATPFLSHSYKTPGVLGAHRAPHTRGFARLSSFALITYVQPKQFQQFTHSFAQRREAIHRLIKRLRALSIATGVVSLS